MILYEYEGKQLLFTGGINVPHSQLLTSPDQEIIIKTPLVLKAQVLSGKRAEKGGIVLIDDKSRVENEVNDLFNEVINKEKVEKVLVEEKIEFETEYYVSLSYDSESRSPILTIALEGGTGVEDRETRRYPINILDSDNIEILKQVQSDTGVDAEVLKKLIHIFFEQDCTLLEINPLVKSWIPDQVRDDGNNNGMNGVRWVALDAKVQLDDDAKKRHEDWNFPPRGVPGYKPTEHEIKAKQIDEGDYRGVAGSTYFDLPGDIAILSSGGGVSLTAMDALIKEGGRPANFTEYSGNPPKEKVAKLTEVVLSKPDIHGLWVIGTIAANFTDIYETLSGLIEGLRQAEKQLDKKFSFPIVIRRGGPRDKEAFEMLSQIKDFDLHLQGSDTSITQSAKVMTQLAKEFTQKQEAHL